MPRKSKKAGQVASDYLFSTTDISTQPNIDSNYNEIGIIHQTETTGINLLRGAVTDIANIFGAKGIDNVIFDRLRNTLLQKIENQLQDMSIRSKQILKISNLRMDIDIQESLIIMTAYGTLLSKKNIT